MKMPWSEFKCPASVYRGKPFWAWNGKLEPDELRRQIRLMQRMGLGGFFMHSRVGLDTAYLSPAWFDGVRTCIDEAKKLGMEAWLYDEDRWPSGAAGGLVTKNPAFHARYLVMREIEAAGEFRWQADTVTAFAGRVEGCKANGLRRLARGARPVLAPGEVVLEFCDVSEPFSDWYNGYTYLDTLNPKAVRKFIAVTHEAYRRRVGRDFGKAVPGIFTDEPKHSGRIVPLPHAGGYGTAWTARLPSVFRKRYGYDLLPRLPEIFLDVDGRTVSQARYHYHECVTHLFTDSFGRQIGAWCRKHGLAFTGHVLMEDTLSSQTQVVGDCMRFYEHMQAPGMDLLTEVWRLWDVAKQVSSAARQFGRKWRLTETYGCTGWDFPFAGHKALGDWQTALGINLRCQHLAWYTMEGEAKRDYPAGIFYQSPWWHSYPKVEDYYARINAVMTHGVEVRDLLVIHPIESMWLLFRKGCEGGKGFGEPEKESADRIGAYDLMLVELRDSLLAANLDFDYGDEELLSRHAKVTQTNGQPILRMAQAAYKAVIVPPLITMRRSTLDLLRRFRAAGGTVVFAGDIAPYVDALPCADVAGFAGQCGRAPARGAALAAAVDALVRRVSIADGAGREIVPALHLLREDAEAFHLFVCNVGHDFLKDRKLLLTESGVPINEPRVEKRTLAFPVVRIRGFAGCKGAPVELDPGTGAVFAAEAVSRGDGWEIRTSLPKLGSRLFVIPKRAGGKRLSRRPALRPVSVRPLGGRSWKIALSENNNLVLDRPRFKVGDGGWQAAREILRVDRAVRDALGLPHRGGAMVQPWARKKSLHPKSIPVALEYGFDVATVPSGAIFLAVERPDTFRICVNDVPLDTDMECGWWVDRSLRKIPFEPAFLRLGRNTLTLECDYDENHPGLEIVYLLGDFGVKVKGMQVTMTAAPRELRLGDWVPQGLAFYSGSVGYLAAIHPRLRKSERLFVEAPGYRGAAVRVTVDGRQAGVIGWEPNEVDITDFLKGQRANLQIEVLGHRRNSHGPLHFFLKRPAWTGPHQFVGDKKEWVDDYQLVPCGLMQSPRLSVRR